MSDIDQHVFTSEGACENCGVDMMTVHDSPFEVSTCNLVRYHRFCGTPIEVAHNNAAIQNYFTPPDYVFIEDPCVFVTRAPISNDAWLNLRRKMKAELNERESAPDTSARESDIARAMTMPAPEFKR